jgi:predicted nuclease with TOPRIM domain
VEIAEAITRQEQSDDHITSLQAEKEELQEKIELLEEKNSSVRDELKRTKIQASNNEVWKIFVLLPNSNLLTENSQNTAERDTGPDYIAKGRTC